MNMVELNLFEFIYYFTFSGILILLFLSITTTFGFIIYDFIAKRYLKSKNDIPFIFKIFLSNAIGITIYISIAFILLSFKLFNFFFAYLPFVILDCFYLVFKIRKATTLKDVFKKIISYIKKEKRKIGILTLCFIIIFTLLLNLIWSHITKSNILLSKDPYYFLSVIYSILDNDSLSLNIFNPIYPQGFSIFCSAALLIKEDYILTFYFLKFAPVFLLFLQVFYIFFIMLKIFKRIYIAFVSSLLFLSFYLYIFIAIVFIPQTLCGFYIGISLIIFIYNKRNIIFLGFILPLLFFINPAIFFLYTTLIIVFLLFYLFYLERKSFKENLRVITYMALITILFMLLYPLSLLLSGSNAVFSLIRMYTESFFAPLNLSFKFLNSLFSVNLPVFFVLIKDLFLYQYTILDNIYDFLKDVEFNVYILTTIMILLFSGIGFISKNRKADIKKIHSLAKFSLIVIFISYILSFLYSNRLHIYRSFIDRIFFTFCPIIIVLCGFGIKYLELILKKIVIFVQQKEKKVSFKLNSNKINKIIRMENIFIFLLIVGITSVQLSQRQLIYEWSRYEFDENEINVNLYLRNNIPSESTILIIEKMMIHYFLYEMEIIKFPINETTTLDDLEDFMIENNNIDYFIFNKLILNDQFENFPKDSYSTIYENSIYIVYEAL